MTLDEYTPWKKHFTNTNELNKKILLNDFFTIYMNREETRKAFNIPADVQAWQQCSDIDYTI